MKDTVIDPKWDIDKGAGIKGAEEGDMADDSQKNSKERSAGPSLSESEAHDPFAHPEPGLKGGAREYIGSLLSGNILSKREIKRLYPLLLFVAFLTIIYISNIFRLQSLYRQHDSLSKEVKELRAESITIASERMNATRQSRVFEEANARGLGLKESVVPPKVVR